jgi:hypothetical protein
VFKLTENYCINILINGERELKQSIFNSDVNDVQEVNTKQLLEMTGTNINDFYRDETNNITLIEQTEKEKLVNEILSKKRLQLLKLDMNKLTKNDRKQKYKLSFLNLKTNTFEIIDTFATYEEVLQYLNKSISITNCMLRNRENNLLGNFIKIEKKYYLNNMA